MENQNSNVEPLLTLHEAADWFGVGVWLLRRAARRGAFPTYRLGNSRVRVRPTEIEAFAQRSRSEVSDGLRKRDCDRT